MTAGLNVDPLADPHGGGALLRAGPTAAIARKVLILVHGRGASADQMLGLAGALGLPDVAAFAPQAAGHSWWPTSFLAPTETLEPWLNSALAAVDRATQAALEEGFSPQQIVLLGFSQGGCLALEAAARRGAPLAAIIGLSAGLAGTSDAPQKPTIRGFPDKAFDYTARLDGVPVYLSCHEDDPHIPLARVHDSARVLEAMGAAAETRIKPGSGHGFDEADIGTVRRLLA
mgnify:CR=1 FL=1